MAVDSFEKSFVMNMQLRQCFSREKPFQLKKARFCLAFSDFQKKPEFHNLASKKPNWQP